MEKGGVKAKERERRKKERERDRKREREIERERERDRKREGKREREKEIERGCVGNEAVASHGGENAGEIVRCHEVTVIDTLRPNRANSSGGHLKLEHFQDGATTAGP